MGHRGGWYSHLKSPQAPGFSRESIHLKADFPAMAEEWLLKYTPAASGGAASTAQRILRDPGQGPLWSAHPELTLFDSFRVFFHHVNDKTEFLGGGVGRIFLE